MAEEEREVAVALARERRPSGERFVRNARERVLVGSAVDLLPGYLLRRHVVDRPEQLPGLGKAAGRPGALRDAEVREVDVILRTDQDVARLDIAMDKPALVRLIECVRDGTEERHRTLGRQRTFLVEQLP